MLTLRSTLSKQTNNTTQKFSGLMTKPHRRNLQEMTLGMLMGESSHLSTIGNAVAKGVTPRKNTERYSRTLEKLDSEACTKRHIACVAPRMKHEPVLILIDGGDVQKPHAKKMENLCKTVDGSNGHATGKGYPTIAGIACGLESGRQVPLFHHLFSTVDEEHKSDWEEQKTCLSWCNPLLHGGSCDRIIVGDRKEDDEKRYLHYLNELQCSFLNRINTGATGRKLCPLRHGEIEDAIAINDIIAQMRGAAGAAREWHNKKVQKDLVSRIAFREVRLPGHNGIPLFLILVYTDGFDDPLVLLTDIDVHDCRKAWTVFFYYKKRWEVENFFRAIKQEFKAEQFLIRDFNAIRSLAFVQMLAFSLLRKIREEAEELLGTVLLLFKEFCRLWQRTKENHRELMHGIREMWRSETSSFQSYHSLSVWRRRCLYCKSRSQLSLFSFREKW